MPNSFKNNFRKSTIAKKLILIGSFAVVAGSFMPWYKDIDKFKTGDMYLGITGPLYLAGLIVLFAAGVSFVIEMSKMLDKNTIGIPMKDDHVHVLSSGISIFMLILSSSVFFHPKFGINIIDKSMGFGMLTAFIGSGVILFGSIMSMKKRVTSLDIEGHLEPLIDIGLEDRKSQTIQNSNITDEESARVKEAIQNSIDEFTENIANTNDIN